MTAIDQRLMLVVTAIKQGVETGTSPSLSVNHHPNPFFLIVNGEVDLKRTADLVLQRLDSYEESVRTQQKKAADEAVEKAAQALKEQPAANDPRV